MTTADLDPTAFEPLDPAVMQCPYPHYAQLRERDPVHLAESVAAYFVTPYDLVHTVCRDASTFSSSQELFGNDVPVGSREDKDRLRAVMAEGYPLLPTLVGADPPEHMRYRRLVSKALSPRVIADLEPLIRSITTRLIDSWIDRPRVELVQQFAVPLPVEMIAKAMNQPDSRLADFKRWSDATVLQVGTNPSMEDRIFSWRGINELFHHFAAELDDRRARPQDDLLSHLLEARIDDDDPEVTDQRPLDDNEILSILFQLLVGGNETTTKMVTEMVRQLGEHPEWWAAVQEDPALIPSVVEEALRMSSPAQVMRRVAIRDVEVGGVTIPKGSRVFPVFGSANHDPERFPDPDRFDPTRPNLTEHLAFGKGPHVCIGAALARLEGRVALEELSSRLASYTLTDSNDFAYDPSFMIRGLLRLELDIVPA